MTRGAGTPGTPGTTTLLVAVWVVLLQAAALAVLACVLTYLDITRGGTTTRIALSVTGYVVTMTVLFLAVGIGLLRRRRWARGPAIVVELLQLPIGYNMLTSGSLLGPLVLGLGLLGAGLLLVPATRNALEIR